MCAVRGRLGQRWGQWWARAGGLSGARAHLTCNGSLDCARCAMDFLRRVGLLQSNSNAMADPPAPAVSARLSGPSAVLRLPEQKAAVLERLLGAAQRLDVMIAQVGAVALQLVRPQEPNPFTPTDRGAETYEPEDLKAMTKAFDVALHDYAMEHFSKNSFRAVHRIPRHCSGVQLGAHLFVPIYGPKKHTQTHAKHDGVGLALASPTHPEQTHSTD